MCKVNRLFGTLRRVRRRFSDMKNALTLRQTIIVPLIVIAFLGFLLCGNTSNSTQETTLHTISFSANDGEITAPWAFSFFRFSSSHPISRDKLPATTNYLFSYKYEGIA